MKKGFFISSILLSHFLFCQTDSLSDVIAIEKVPVTQSKLTSSEIQKLNLAKDVPMLLNHTVSAVATSDAGNGVGYTGIRIRGTDASKTIVNIDGVPINDSESQSVFWVDMPDVVSTAKNIVIERGIGTSSNGMANFGTSINVTNSGFKDSAQITYNGTLGSFSTYKNSLVAEAGNLVGNKFRLKARVSQLNSDGYIDRSWAKLWSYQIQSEYKFNPKSKLSFNFFGGKEKTYQAWYGIDKYTLETNRKFNYAGAIYKEDGTISGFYPNQIDDYLQNHYTLKWNYKIDDSWNFSLLSFYTFGKGYYEEYVQNQNLIDYKIDRNDSVDLVRRLWLKNHFYGISAGLNYQKNNWINSFQLGLNQYIGNHYGQVINSAILPLTANVEYYRNKSHKNEFTSYLKSLYKIQSAEIYTDVQFRHVQYVAQTPNSGKSDIESNPNFSHNYTFINPKIGLNYYLKNNRLYFLMALSHREPTRTDLLENPFIKPERLSDIELGINSKFNKLTLTSNLYWMNYTNQLILSGRLDNVGNPIKENSGKSYRLGWETEVNYSINNWLNVFGNFTLSTNKNSSYSYTIDGNVQTIKNSSIAFSPSFISNFGVELKPIKNVEFQLINKYVGEQYLDNSENKNLRLSAYNLLDVFVQYHPQFLKKTPLDISAQFFNVLNRKYVNNGYVYSSEPYFYPQAGFNFLIGIKLGF